MKTVYRYFCLFFCLMLIAGCTPVNAASISPTGTAIVSETAVVYTSTAAPQPSIVKYYVQPSVPASLIQAVNIPSDWQQVDTLEDGAVSLGDVSGKKGASWVYALAAPFPTLLDQVSLKDLKQAWTGDSRSSSLSGSPLLVSKSTRAAFEALWGKSGTQVVTVSEELLLDKAWDEKVALAIIPFEQISPRWKIILVEGQSPLFKSFSPDDYPLVVHFDWNNLPEGVSATGLGLPETNRDSQKLTIVTMTGTTALVRAIGAKMEKNGMTYPAQGGILDWFTDADYVHISNEVSFSSTCPPANAEQKTLQFCSRPEYLELLEYVNANIIELTGNHLLDWDLPAFENTLDIYKQHNMQVYAGGKNQAEARLPLKLVHNGNKLAFIGCNAPGPELVWALDNRAGAAWCDDYEWMKNEIQSLLAEGYLPIVSLQYGEGYGIKPTVYQQADFQSLSDAGAVIVSGSQAHFPQTVELRSDRFIHYGLGNLFFDMMRNPYDLGTDFDLGGEKPVEGVRVGVVDQHVFYDGRYINTALLTEILEDFSQPRPLTNEEREKFLAVVFKAAGW